MKTIVFTFTLALLATSTHACPNCRPLVEAGIQTDFTATALSLAAPLFIIFTLGIALYNFDSIRDRLRRRNI
jgi:hypothetical protein